MTKPDDIAALRAQLADLSAKLDALQAQPAKAEKWDPKGGDWYVNHGGCVYRTPSDEPLRLFGIQHETQISAESAVPYMRFHNRLLCLAAELNPSGKVGGTHGVCYGGSEAWGTITALGAGDPDSLFENRRIAEKACETMNRDGWKIETT